MKTISRVYRHRPQEVVTVEDARAHSEADLKDATAFIARAFNVCDNPDLRYRFDRATRDRVFDLCVQLLSVWKEGDLQIKAESVAAGDPAFQRMLAALTRVDV